MDNDNMKRADELREIVKRKRLNEPYEPVREQEQRLVYKKFELQEHDVRTNDDAWNQWADAKIANAIAEHVEKVLSPLVKNVGTVTNAAVNSYERQLKEITRLNDLVSQLQTKIEVLENRKAWWR